jgi:trehalose 6-phosphate synthase
VAATSRKDVDSYRELREELEAAAGALNATVGAPDWTPLRLLTTATAREAGAGFMRLARVGLVTPVRDGMNLVAKEFVAAQDPDDPGVLVLSQFAGAAQQLTAALLVNPHDSHAMADALDTALRMDAAERRARWRDCWEALEDRSPLGWGRAFVAQLLRARNFTQHVGGQHVGIVGGSYRATAPAFAEPSMLEAGAKPARLPRAERDKLSVIERMPKAFEPATFKPGRGGQRLN